MSAVKPATGAASRDRDVVGARLGVAAARAADRQTHRVHTRGSVHVRRILDAAGAGIAKVPGVGGDRPRGRVREVNREGRGAGCCAGSKACNRSCGRDRDVVGPRLGVAAARAADRQTHRVHTRGSVHVRRVLDAAGAGIAEVPGVGGDRPGRRARKVHAHRRRAGSGVGSKACNRSGYRNADVVGPRLGIAAARAADCQTHRVHTGGSVHVRRILDAAGAGVAEVPGVSGDRPGRRAREVHAHRRRTGGGVGSKACNRSRSRDRDVVGARLGVAAARAADRQTHRVHTRGGVHVRRILDAAGAGIAEVPGVGGDRPGRRAREVHAQSEAYRKSCRQ